jgi:hypothetical protein
VKRFDFDPSIRKAEQRLDTAHQCWVQALLAQGIVCVLVL